MISPRQRRVYEFIRNYIASNGEAPKFTEIAKYFKYRSWSTVHRILGLLEDEGLIIRNPRLKRGIQLVPPRHCPICARDLPVNEFGICRARKDGRNLYCKSCIRKKVYASRQLLKEYKQTKNQVAELKIATEPEIATVENITKVAPIDRVRSAIRRGARTQCDIRRETKLGKDEIGDALANLLLWKNEIKTLVVDGTRIYLMNSPAQVEQRSFKQSLPLIEFAQRFGPQVKGVRAA